MDFKNILSKIKKPKYFGGTFFIFVVIFIIFLSIINFIDYCTNLLILPYLFIGGRISEFIYFFIQELNLFIGILIFIINIIVYWLIGWFIGRLVEHFKFKNKILSFILVGIIIIILYLALALYLYSLNFSVCKIDYITS